MSIQDELFEMQDTEYKTFNSKLIPNINPDSIIGIRTPQLRKFAKEFAKREESEKFLNSLPHKYYEENNLHGCIVELIKNYDKAIEETEKFLPYIDNWATCDLFMPKILKKNTDKLIDKIYQWLQSKKTYTVRFAIGLLMSLYLEENFNENYMSLVASVHSNEYYINMMIAWYFATALVKQYSCAIIYLTENKLDVWVHNKSIQKAVESRRIDDETKRYLKTLKRKI